ncbi:carbohydrate kinase family protein [Candidatus Peregrinibacteria bacterium]|nr:carbohydrate kinase family protein [Candidatus Peregrinibacteria bacterium]
MKQPKIFTIGGATFDMFIRAHDHGIMEFKTAQETHDWLCLEHGGKVKIDEVHETFGGGATNTGVAFARMGFEVSTVVKVGSEYGDKVIDNLKKEGVDTRFIKHTSRDKTAFSTILNTFEGDRTVLAYSGANQYFTVKDLPLKDIKEADWIFLNHLTAEDNNIPRAILRILKENPHIKLAWNPGKEQLKQGIRKWKSLLDHTEILFVNKEEASLFARTPYKPAGIKSEDPKRHNHLPRSFLPPYADDVSEIMYQFFSKTDVKQVVITDSKNGAQASDGRHLYFCPVVLHKLVDATGAGDAFASGFTSAIILGESLKNALKYGTLNAHNVINYYGAQAGLLTREQIGKKLKQLDICVESTKLN